MAIHDKRTTSEHKWREGLIVGGYYSTAGDSGGFKIVKILAMDERGVHVRLYANRFDTRPKALNPADLTLGMSFKALESGAPVEMSMGHLPLSWDSFRARHPDFLYFENVSPDELEGYRLWKESGGGFF